MPTKSKIPSKLKKFKDINKSSLAKIKNVKTKSKMDYPNLQQFTGPRTTASSQAEGRLKVAAKSKYKTTLKASIKKAKANKGFLNMK